MLFGGEDTTGEVFGRANRSTSIPMRALAAMAATMDRVWAMERSIKTLVCSCQA